MDETLAKIERLKHLKTILHGTLESAIREYSHIVTSINYDYEALKWAIDVLQGQYVARHSE